MATRERTTSTSSHGELDGPQPEAPGRDRPGLRGVGGVRRDERGPVHGAHGRRTPRPDDADPRGTGRPAVRGHDPTRCSTRWSTTWSIWWSSTRSPAPRPRPSWSGASPTAAECSRATTVSASGRCGCASSGSPTRCPPAGSRSSPTTAARPGVLNWVMTFSRAVTQLRPDRARWSPSVPARPARRAAAAPPAWRRCRPRRAGRR